MINAITIELIVIKPITNGDGLEYYGILLEHDSYKHLEVHHSFDEPYHSIPFPDFENNLEALDYAFSKMRHSEIVWRLVNDNRDSKMGLTINGEYFQAQTIGGICDKYFPTNGYEPSEFDRNEAQRQRLF